MNTGKLSGVSSLVPNDALESEEIDLLAAARVLWRGKWWIALSCAVFVLLGGYYTYVVATPQYKATARVEFFPETAPLLDLNSVISGSSTDEVSLNTRIENTQSREMIEKLTRDLDLDQMPEFNGALREPSQFSLGALLRLVGLRGEPELRAPEVQADLEFRSTVQAVSNAISVNTQRKTHIFDITARSQNPETAAQLANTLAEIYIEDQKAKKFENTEQAIDWLSNEARDLETELRAQEDEIRALREDTDLINPEALEALGLRAKEFRDRLEKRQIDLTEQEAKLVVLQSAWDSTDPELIIEAFSDPILTRLGRSLLLDGQGDADRTAFDQRAERLLSSQQRILSQIKGEVAALEESLSFLQGQLREQTADLQRLEQMQRELTVTQDLYKTFLTGLQEATVQVGLVRADTRLMSVALPPLEPVSPQHFRTLLVAFVLGGLVASAVLLIREFSNKSIRTASDLEALTGHAVLGHIPVLPVKRRQKVLNYLRDKPTSAAAEAIRNLRTSVLLSNIDNPPQVIMSTSSIPGEGKTTQSIALAMSFAGLDKKVLLIEGDMRRRVFSDYFDLNRDKGLISVLAGDRDFDDVVAPESSLNVDILVGEKSSTNAADVYSSDRFKQFLTEMRERYDFVIIDTPPVLAVPDARVIGQSVDAIIYTVKWDSTTQRQISDGLKAFETANVKVTGLVLGQINAKGMKGYGYGDSYAAYSSYYD